MDKIYLGDAVYAELENNMLKLTTEYGNGPPSNTIYLEYSVIVSLLRYLKKHSVIREDFTL